MCLSRGDIVTAEIQRMKVLRNVRFGSIANISSAVAMSALPPIADIGYHERIRETPNPIVRPLRN